MQALVQQATPPNPNQVVFAFRECIPAGRRGFPRTISAPGKPPLPTEAKGYHPPRPPQKEMAVTQPTSRGWQCPPDALTQANVEGCVDITKLPGVTTLLYTGVPGISLMAEPLKEVARGVLRPPAGARLPHGTAAGIGATRRAVTLDQTSVDSLDSSEPTSSSTSTTPW